MSSRLARMGRTVGRSDLHSPENIRQKGQDATEKIAIRRALYRGARERTSSDSILKLTDPFDGDLRPTIDSEQSDGANTPQEIFGISWGGRMANCIQSKKKMVG